MNMRLIFSHLRREYWENRFWLFVLPVILSVLLLALSVTLAKHISELSAAAGDLMVFQPEQPSSRTLDFSAGAKPLGQGDAEPGDGSQLELPVAPSIPPEETPFPDANFSTSFDDSPLALLAIYLAGAWLVSGFYFAACLYSDRQDNSILFWKSLPVTEVENVMAKLLFGTFGFTLAAMIVGWLCWLVICLVGMATPMGHYIFADMTVSSVLSAVYTAPLLVLLGCLRALPLIGLLMLLSALAKRSPLLWVVVGVILVVVTEKLVFGTGWVKYWLGWHLPMASLEVTEAARDGSILMYHMKELLSHPFMLISGILVGLAALAAAVWCREQHFEI